MPHEQPGYTVEERRTDFELRGYDAYLVAETEVDGNQGQAGSDARPVPPTDS